MSSEDYTEIDSWLSKGADHAFSLDEELDYDTEHNTKRSLTETVPIREKKAETAPSYFPIVGGWR